MRILFFTLLAAFSGLSLASNAVGRVEETNGAVTVGPDRTSTGQSVVVGARINAAPEADVALRMADDGLIMLDQSSDFLVDQYRFDPQQADGSQARFVLNYGTARLISGVMSKIKPGSVTLSTAFGDITTLGTDYTVGVCTSGCVAKKGLYISVRKGLVRLSTQQDSIIIGADQILWLDEKGGAPVYLSEAPAFMAALSSNLAVARFESGDGETSVRLGVDTQEFLSGVIDPPASPSQPVARASR
jgi:hypothetical protein